MLANTTLFFVLILTWFFLKTKTNWLGIVGLLMGFGGVVLMVSRQLGGAENAGDFVLGMALALLGAAGWASVR